jgi:hypothetical protein
MYTTVPCSFTVVIMTLFAIKNYHWPICWLICFMLFVRLSFPYWNWRRVIPYKGARRVWPVSRGCLLLLGTCSYLCICWWFVLPYIQFCNCLLDYDYDLHIVNFVILYLFRVRVLCVHKRTWKRQEMTLDVVRNSRCWRRGSMFRRGFVLSLCKVDIVAVLNKQRGVNSTIVAILLGKSEIPWAV